MHRTVLGHHDTSDAIKELEIIDMPNTNLMVFQNSVFPLYLQFRAHNPTEETFIQNGDIIELPPLSDGTIQRVEVVNLGIGTLIPFLSLPVTVNQPGALNDGKFYDKGYTSFFTTPVLIDGDKISYAQSYNELWGKKIKLISYTERNQSKDVGLFVSRPSSNVLDPVQARSGNLAFDSSRPLGSLRVLQTGTFQIQCKKTFMGKKGGLELLSDEQNRENVDYTKLYPFEVNQQEGSFVDNSPSNANTIMLGYKEGQEPITGNAFSHEFVQNVYCDYGTTTVVFDPPLPKHIKTPHVSLHFAVANSSGHFHPWYANVTCTTGEEDYKWQYANSQHCVHMDTAWFRGKWSLRERTLAPFGTNLNNDYDKVGLTNNTHIGGVFGELGGDGIVDFNRLGRNPNQFDEYTSKALKATSRQDSPGRPFGGDYMGYGESRRLDENQMGLNLPRYANPTMVVDTDPSKRHSIPYRESEGTANTLLGMVDPFLFNAEPGDPGQSNLPNAMGRTYGGDNDVVADPPEGSVKGSEIRASQQSGTGVTHLRAKSTYYDYTTGNPYDTLAGQGKPAQAVSRADDNGPQSYESSLSMNSPTSVWGGAFKSFAGMQGVTYFANNTHLKIDAFMTPTHTPTPFETEIEKTRVKNPHAAHGDLSKFDWLGNYLGDGTTPNQEFDEFGNIRKNVGIGIDGDSETEFPHFKTEINAYKRQANRWADQDGQNDYTNQNHMTDYLRNYLTPTQSIALNYSWSNVVHRAANAGYGLDYIEQLPRKFRTKYWDGSATEYEWWPLGHANGHFTISYGTRTKPFADPEAWGVEAFANTILARVDSNDDRHHDKWNDWFDEYGGSSGSEEYEGFPGVGNLNTPPHIAGGWTSEDTFYGDDRSKLEAQFLDESREMGYDDEDLKIFRGHPVYMAACYGDYRPIAFIGSDTDSAGGARGINYVRDVDLLDDLFVGDGVIYDDGTGPAGFGNTHVNQLRDSRYGPQKFSDTIIEESGGLGSTDQALDDQLDEWSPFWPILNKGTRFPNQLPNTEGKGYPTNSQYEPGDAFLKTRTFQGQPTGLDSFWNSFSNNMSQYVAANTPYGEFYYADGGYAIDFSPYFNYAGGSHIYSAEKREQRVVDGSDTYRMMKLIPTDFNIQKQSLQKHNWHGGNPKAGVGTEGKRFGFGGAGSAQALGGEGEGVFDTYIGRYVVYDLEGGDADV
jgi:hypothetical protein